MRYGKRSTLKYCLNWFPPEVTDPLVDVFVDASGWVHFDDSCGLGSARKMSVDEFTESYVCSTCSRGFHPVLTPLTREAEILVPQPLLDIKPIDESCGVNEVLVQVLVAEGGLRKIKSWPAGEGFLCERTPGVIRLFEVNSVTGREVMGSWDFRAEMLYRASNGSDGVLKSLTGVSGEFYGLYKLGQYRHVSMVYPWGIGETFTVERFGDWSLLKAPLVVFDYFESQKATMAPFLSSTREGHTVSYPVRQEAPWGVWEMVAGLMNTGGIYQDVTVAFDAVTSM